MFKKLANVVGISDEDAKIIAGFAKIAGFVGGVVVASHLAVKLVDKLID